LPLADAAREALDPACVLHTFESLTQDRELVVRWQSEIEGAGKELDRILEEQKKREAHRLMERILAARSVSFAASCSRSVASKCAARFLRLVATLGWSGER